MYTVHGITSSWQVWVEGEAAIEGLHGWQKIKNTGLRDKQIQLSE